VDGAWTILELAELAAEALAGGQSSVDAEGESADVGRANGRVRDVPNERLVRWYVTTGLVDPPLSRRGRVARYGQRHLFQLVAVKRRQAEGRSLAEIQAELAGATDDMLAGVARIPDVGPASGVAPVAPARFWMRSAAPRGQADAEGAGEPGLADAEGAGEPGVGGADGFGELGVGGAEGAGELVGAEGGSRVVHGVRLAAGVTLLLEGAGREPGPEDVSAILNAARALLAELAGRRLCEPGPERLADVPGLPPTEESRT
jgi:MerR HTH family regulatory protein